MSVNKCAYYEQCKYAQSRVNVGKIVTQSNIQTTQYKKYWQYG